MSPAQLPTLKEVVPTLHPSGVLELRLNTPGNLNSLTIQKQDLVQGLNYAKANKDVVAVVVTSTGRFFSSGASISPGGMGGGDIKKGENPARDYIDALIDFPKLLVAALQGPAYGIAVTMLPHFDIVYAAPETTLTTPFSRIGICLEGCSSVLFPPLFGPVVTSRLLYLAETVPLADIEHSGLIREVLPAEGLQTAVVRKVEAVLNNLVPESIIASKSLTKSPKIRKELHRINKEEMATVEKCRASQAHADAIARFAAEAAAKKAAKAKL
ncbi:Enoyl-CoA delta isomerase 2, mitochondrial [Vanrija pseudolonga]|uniref:Enoyl-CoA delta isomerase 2, mitochondrial n=1 Tax=Vanrija pseudolonga TaxID=143232 RepID=A0AAF0Y405_9TREE|nr:Enoyl-CoA delta isomerase 2, mitochondrial [Vanrija pseudolonga]